MSNTKNAFERKTVDSLMVGPAEAAAMLGLAKSTFDKLLAAGRIGPVGVKLGRRRLFDVSELRAWVKLGSPARGKYEAIRRV